MSPGALPLILRARGEARAKLCEIKMIETKQTFADDEGEETMVAPRFDDEETMVARPVVPFEEVGDEPAVAPVPVSTTAAPPYSSMRGTPRRSLVAVLVLVSALVGSVLGVAGLYFYQNRKSADAPAAERQQQAEEPTAQATTETASETKRVETSAPAAVESSAPAPAAAEPEDDADEAHAAKDKDSDEADASPVAERRGSSEDRAPVATPKHGKKGSRDEEIQRVQRAPRHDEDSRPVVRDEVSDDDDRRVARRVGVITYRPRRVRPRRDRDDSPDRLRRIFEGQP